MGTGDQTSAGELGICHSSPLRRSKFCAENRHMQRPSLPLSGHQKVSGQSKDVSKPSEYYFVQLNNKFPLVDHCLVHDIRKEVSHATRLEGNPFGSLWGGEQSRADLWHHHRHYRKYWDQTEETPQSSPEAGLPACEQILRVGNAVLNPACMDRLPIQKPLTTLSCERPGLWGGQLPSASP